jgi:formylglycine-generating enzyme required for sulfatase activity
VFAIAGSTGSGAAGYVPAPAPPGGDFSLSDLVEKDKAAKAGWATWLGKMKSDFATAQGFETSSADAGASAEAWGRFLTVYAADDPFSSEDEGLREEAQQRRTALATQAARAAEAAAAAAAEAERKKQAASGGAEWVRLAGGRLQMGSEEGSADEKPVHAVDVAAFEMMSTEVTVAQYRKCVEAGKCAAPNNGAAGWSEGCNYGAGGRDGHPVNCVTAAESEVFCAWAGGRLPTEEEWEYAARGKAGRRYAWGNAEPDASRVNACGSECVRWAKDNGKGDFPAMYSGDDGWPTTAPARSFDAGRTPEGPYHMSGNVWE